MSNEHQSKRMDQLGKINLKKLKSLRKKFDLTIEKDRHEFIRQIDPIISDWEGQLPNLRDIFRPEEIDRLLMEGLKCDVLYNVFGPDPLVDFVIRTGYRDEPELGTDGKPSSSHRRTTAVHYAAERRHLDTVTDLFKIYDRCDVNYSNESGLTHFHAACMSGCDDVVEKFLEAGQQPDCVWPKAGDSPLHMALAGGHGSVARSLVTRGADPNLANKAGSTPLHVVCKSYRDDGLLEMFFEINGERNQTVRVDAQDEQGQTPLHFALLWGNKSAVESLLRKGADPNLANKAGLTALHIHCDRVDDDRFAETMLETSRDMNRTLRVDARDASGNTPLQTAVARGHEKMIGFLLRNGADPNSADAEGSTALHNICRRDDVDDMMEIFLGINEELDKPVRLDARDNSGRTPLQWAVANLKTNLFDSLLNHGADLSGFVFPTENYFAERYAADCEIQLVTLPTMYIVKTLERKGYRLDVAAVVTVMKTFVGHGLVGRAPTDDLDERWHNDATFARIAKKHRVGAQLSLYDFVRLTPDQAEKLFIAIEDYEEFLYGFRLLPMGPYQACIEHVSRALSRGFFRRWAMEFFTEMTRQYRLPILCCDMIVEQLANEDLLRIGLAIAGQN
ncbi:serine/threonine-protein phosphatase 6 regulatory ankyrin repeat subunit B-like [Trichogramma pretiosum]|uniref:serine/threonine-protein phosphatase 6 regulatory ankyrin repeat subunit B-like n=1 Tax=Trichogramma pretiosum TaxID=7493 RepID=UPI000C71AEAE|nr:serine/threonine-protein phosphatase 6 regulatory ankyrin repeat subunit B-like [Trichogramma pretiosum]